MLYEINDHTNIDKVSLTDFLSSETTKRYLTLYLANKYITFFTTKVSQCYAVAQNLLLSADQPFTQPIMTVNHDEADALLVWFSIYYKLQFGADISIDIICSDTDVLLLLLNFAKQLPRRIVVITASHSFSIGMLFEALGERVCTGLLSLHSLTGCDKTGKFSGKGKVKWFQKYLLFDNNEFYHHMKTFGEHKEVSEEAIQCISTFISSVYSGKKTSLSNARWVLFTQLKEGEQLPPTPAFFQHILRALLQTFEWKSATRAIVEKLNICDYGWYKEGELFLPVPMVFDALPTSLKEFVSCKCKGRM